MSVHPYARTHWIPVTFMPWGPAGWVFPNATDDGVGLRGRLQQAAALKPELWPTEFGYALQLNTSLAGQYARTHAAAVAQSVLLMRASAAVKRFFYFCVDCGHTETIFDYSLWRCALVMCV